MVLLLLLLSMASSLYAAQERDESVLEVIRSEFDARIDKALTHHKLAEIFNDAVNGVEPLNIERSLKDETFRYFVNAVTKREEKLLDALVASAPKIAEAIKRIEYIQGEKHRLLALVDDLQNVPRAARTSAEKYITKCFDDRQVALAGGVGAGPIVAPADVKRHAHEHVVSVHQQHDKLTQMVIQFYTEINNKRLNSRDMQHKLDTLITHINDLSGVSAADKEGAIKDATTAAEVRLEEQGQKLPSRGAPAKKTRKLKGRVPQAEETEAKTSHARSSKTEKKPKSGESVTQEAARLRTERAAKNR